MINKIVEVLNKNLCFAGIIDGGQLGNRVPYLGLSLDLSYWVIWHSAGSVARSDLVSGSPCFQAHVSPSLSPWSLCS